MKGKQIIKRKKCSSIINKSGSTAKSNTINQCLNIILKYCDSHANKNQTGVKILSNSLIIERTNKML